MTSHHGELAIEKSFIDNANENACGICARRVDAFFCLGKQPHANRFLPAEDISKENRYELELYVCLSCMAVQLLEQPPVDRLFNDAYPFYSGSSQLMRAHFETMAQESIERLKGRTNPFAVEIGSNDGSMLSHFASSHIRHLGIEPSANVAAIARARGVRTISQFFDVALARDIVTTHGQADLICATNTLSHISRVSDAVEAMAVLLASDGEIAIEDPYLLSVLQKNAFDQLYDAHAFVFSATAIRKLARSNGLELCDLQPQWTHGGSMRYRLRHRGRAVISERVIEALEAEKAQGLGRHETYLGFQARCLANRSGLVKLLEQLHAEGKKVIGYPAPAKSTTVLNFCGIGPRLVECLVDSSPFKQGKVSPGMHLPVITEAEFRDKLPDYVLVFGWNHFEEIRAKERDFEERGGRWILYIPEVRMIESRASTRSTILE